MEIKAKIDGSLVIADLNTGTKIINDVILGEFQVSEYQTLLVKLNAGEEKTISLTDIDNIRAVVISVLEGAAQFKVDPASTAYIDVQNLILEGTVPALIIKAVSLTTIKVDIVGKKA